MVSFGAVGTTVRVKRAYGAFSVIVTTGYQYGPNCVRDSRDLRAALAILNERGRARMEEGGRRRCVAVNPALLDGRE